MTASADPGVEGTSATASGVSLIGAWALALVATLGALFVGEVMGQTPCDLCWYQRIFMFPLVILLGIAAYRGDAGGFVYTLPLALAGVVVAGFHSSLYAGLLPETIEPCGAGPSCSSADMTILGSLPLPFLSLAAFVAITILLLVSRKSIST